MYTCLTILTVCCSLLLVGDRGVSGTGASTGAGSSTTSESRSSPCDDDEGRRAGRAGRADEPCEELPVPCEELPVPCEEVPMPCEVPADEPCEAASGSWPELFCINEKKKLFYSFQYYFCICYMLFFLNW